MLWNVLTNLADIKYAHTLNLQALVDEFPQSGLLKALLAGNGDEQNVKHAAVYFNPSTLYKLVKAPDSLPTVTAAQIFQMDMPLPGRTFDRPFSNTYANKLWAEQNNASPATDRNLDVTEDKTGQSQPPVEADAEHKVSSYDIIYVTEHKQEEELPVYETAVYDLVSNDSADEVVTDNTPPVAEEIKTVTEEIKIYQTPEDEPVYGVEDKAEYFHQDIEDTIYDEIVSQDIEDEVYDEIVSIEDINLGQQAASTIAPDDHFAFEQDSSTAEEIENNTPPEAIIPANEVAFLNSNNNRDVSQYNDEKLPYTFMWWLDKTRKEHDANYQPYINYPLRTSGGIKNVVENKVDELQQQYVENIFNINGFEELERSTAQKNEERAADRKKDKIVKRFIEAEPQIKHAGGLRLDNENKAKRSSEDSDEMVTETLARIYTEQMLYPKAIATYKKLMLKFPEKRVYFAGQIEQLEKKPN